VIASGLFPGESLSKEPRGALLARIGTQTAPAIYVVNTHLGLTNQDRLRQAKSLLGSDWLGRVPAEAALIVTGDFNMTPASLPYRLISNRVKDAQLIAKAREGNGTFPSPWPLTRLDYMFVSNHFTVERLIVPRNTQTRVASDHLPLVADLSG
jgi:endonuclease/exonuclease/phosphatase family metal-dependent hydrolase